MEFDLNTCLDSRHLDQILEFLQVFVDRCHPQRYGRLLVAHIDKENNVLYVMAERVLSADKMAEMAKSFLRIEELEIGPNKHEEFHATLHALKDIYLA